MPLPAVYPKEIKSEYQTTALPCLQTVFIATKTHKKVYFGLKKNVRNHSLKDR